MTPAPTPEISVEDKSVEGLTDLPSCEVLDGMELKTLVQLSLLATRAMQAFVDMGHLENAQDASRKLHHLMVHVRYAAEKANDADENQVPEGVTLQ